MKRVIIESPYAGDVKRNTEYVRKAMRDALLRGEAPFASHALYTLPSVLDDQIPEERELGMTAGWEWMAAADEVIGYMDLGESGGMREGLKFARGLGIPIKRRMIL